MFYQTELFRVCLGSFFSNIHEQEMVVPQGSILPFTLFILKINRIADVIPSSFEKSLLVDDFSISCFSKTKIVCMHFCNKRKLHSDQTLTICYI